MCMSWPIVSTAEPWFMDIFRRPAIMLRLRGEDLGTGPQHHVVAMRLATLRGHEDCLPSRLFMVIVTVSCLLRCSVSLGAIELSGCHPAR
jgi:hypothetical protein